MNRLPASWQTDRLHVADGVLDNVPLLMAIATQRLRFILRKKLPGW